MTDFIESLVKRDAEEKRKARRRLKEKFKDRESLATRINRIVDNWEMTCISDIENTNEILRYPCREKIPIMDGNVVKGYKFKGDECVSCWPHGHSKYWSPFCKCGWGAKPEKCNAKENEEAEARFRIYEDRVKKRNPNFRGDGVMKRQKHYDAWANNIEKRDESKQGIQ